MKIKLKKKETEVKEPQYYLSETNMQTYNYKVYYMSFIEKIITFIVVFAIGGLVAYTFYGGIGKDEYGQQTIITLVCNIVIICIGGLLGAKFLFPLRIDQIIKKQQKTVVHQFRDMLDGLTASLGAGKNTPDSFYAVYNDLKIQYDETSYIVKELEVIIAGLNNNIPIENIIIDFGDRSGSGDIVSFANVFKIAHEKGGNLKDIVRNTHNILSEKMGISNEIDTMVTSGKLESNLMLVMPVGIVAMMKGISPEFANNFVTPIGLISTTISVAMFIGAYFIGRALLDIKV